MMTTEVSFKNPPVVETVLGVQFERLAGLTNAHLGAFWQGRRSSWPQVEDAHPLEERLEPFGQRGSWREGVRLHLSQTPLARVKMRNESGDRMIQIQNCRLDYNWIGKPGQQYPRYRTVRPEFDSVREDFIKFIHASGLGPLAPTQWEVTYVNHILKDTIWTKPEDWCGVLSGLPGLAVAPQGTKLEGFGSHWHFEILPQKARLHVEVQHAYLSDAGEALVMHLTARGPTEKEFPLLTAIDHGLNLGHEVIVRSFVELTSACAHEFWNSEVKR